EKKDGRTKGGGTGRGAKGADGAKKQRGKDSQRERRGEAAQGRRDKGKGHGEVGMERKQMEHEWKGILGQTENGEEKKGKR
ncbi:hypothetical protein, partial [Staphylococcus aureus]